MLGKSLWICGLLVALTSARSHAAWRCDDGLLPPLKPNQFRASIRFQADGMRKGQGLVLATLLSSSDPALVSGQDVGVYFPEGRFPAWRRGADAAEFRGLVLVRDPKKPEQLYFEVAQDAALPEKRDLYAEAPNQFSPDYVRDESSGRGGSMFSEIGHGNLFGDGPRVRGEEGLRRDITDDRRHHPANGHGSRGPDPDFNGDHSGQNGSSAIFDRGTGPF